MKRARPRPNPKAEPLSPLSDLCLGIDQPRLLKADAMPRPGDYFERMKIDLMICAVRLLTRMGKSVSKKQGRRRSGRCKRRSRARRLLGAATAPVLETDLPMRVSKSNRGKIIKRTSCAQNNRRDAAMHRLEQGAADQFQGRGR